MVGIGTTDLNTAVHASRFSLLGSCSSSGSVRGSWFGGSWFGASWFCVRLFAGRGNEQKKHGGGGRKAGAGRERGGRAEPFVQEAEDHAGGQRADAEGGVVEAECGAVAIGGGEVRDERLLGAFSQGEVHAIEQEPRHEANCRRRGRKPDVDERVDPPAENYHALAAETIGQAAAPGR